MICVATPDDGSDAGAEVSSAPITVLNTAPTLAAATINQAQIYEATTVTCTALGWLDADGDLLGDVAPGGGVARTIFEWRVNGNLVGPSPILTGANFSRGDELICVATPHDGREAGTPVSSAPVTVLNTAPTLLGAAINQSAIYETTAVTCMAWGWLDVDGEQLGDIAPGGGVASTTFEWRVNGNQVGPTAVLTGTDFNRGDELVCVATPTDGLALGAGVLSPSVTVLNSPPSAPSTVIVDPAPAPWDAVECAAAGAHDDDGDPLSYSYAWTLGGSSNVVATGSTLSSSHTEGNQDWTCTATPSDGLASGPSLSASTTIQHLRPATAPDWAIYSVSGHCVTSCFGSEDNPEYLEAQGTLGFVVSTMQGEGYSVESFAYADEFYNKDNNSNELEPGQGNPTTFGFLQLLEDLEAVRDDWVSDFDNPTRVMFLGHSHGTVWVHTAVYIMDDLDIEMVIDLDGVVSNWEQEVFLTGIGDDWADVITDYGGSWPFDIAHPRDAWNVPGVSGAQDTEDTLPNHNVTRNLEVQSDPFSSGGLYDDDDNHRLNGSTSGIHRHSSSSEDHGEVAEPNSTAMNWVRQRLRSLY